MNFVESYKPQRSVLWKATLLFILVGGLLVASDQLSIRYGLEGWQRIVDDVLGGLIAGSIFYLYECHRLRQFSKHLHVIDLMNHHIRNALQPLMFLTHKPEGKAPMKLVEECVRRIEWALREVLPGKSEEQFVVHDGGGFVPKIDSSIPSRAPSSSEPKESRPESTTGQPSILFSQWLDTWRSRNERNRAS
jgi:hypothetical protein